MKRTPFTLLILLPIALGLLAICASARAEPVFNALDPGDPQYAEYQHNLCQDTLETYHRLSAEKSRLDHGDPRLAGKTPAEREDWVVNYAVTASLRDTWRERYQANCHGRFVKESEDQSNVSAATISQYEREQARRKRPGNHDRTAPAEAET
jgi:O-methyltransferase involved in polyketide biosynthesis